MIPEINLLPKYERQSTVLYRLFLIGLIAIILVFIGFVYVFFQTKADIERADEHNRVLEEQKNILDLQVANVGTSTPESLESVIDFAEGYVVPTSKLIEEFINLLPDHAYVSEYDYVFGAVEIESQFETKNDVSAYVTSLLGSDYMNDVKIEQVESIEFEGKEIEDKYDTILRHNVRYLLDINLAKLAEEAHQDE
jgi:Tfp pilus assembly protein PilN